MRTAVLVLGILGVIFGAVAVLGALGLGALQRANPLATGGAATTAGALLALGALVLVIVALVFVGQQRFPRVTGAMLVVAAILGSVGTLGFLPASLLIAIAGILAFFVKPVAAIAAAAPTVAPPPAITAAVTAADPGAPAAATPPVPRRAFVLSSTRSRVLAGGVVLVVVLGLILASTIGQAREQQPARVLFSGLSSYDTVALANLLPPQARKGDPSADAERALTIALADSQIAFLANDWLRRFGPASEVKLVFERLEVTTLSKEGDSAKVRVSGVFSPSHENALANAGLRLLRTAFSANIAVRQAEGQWYLDAPAVVATPGGRSNVAPPAAAPTAARTGSSTTAPTAAPVSVTARPTATPSPSPTPSPTPIPFAATFTANFSDPAGGGLPTKASTNAELRYQGGHALLTGCSQVTGTPFRCVWGVNRAAPGFVAVSASGQADNEWGVLFRAAPEAWSTGTNYAAFSEGQSTLQSATLASIRSDGSWAVGFITSGLLRVVAEGKPDEIPTNRSNTIELGIDGAQVYARVNGREVARIPDAQTRPGLGYGVYVRGDRPRSLDLSYFGGR